MSGDELARELGEVGGVDRPAVGGKGASLGELARAGIRVPAGYVITVRAFERALRVVDPAGEIRREIEELPADDTAAIVRVSAHARDRIAGAQLPGDVRDQITARYRALGDGAVAGREAAATEGEAAVAVRSSATRQASPAASPLAPQGTSPRAAGPEARVRRRPERPANPHDPQA